MSATTKTCSKCKRELPRADFFKAKRRRDGLQSRCRECCGSRPRVEPQVPTDTEKPVTPIPHQARPGEFSSIYGGKLCDRGHRYWGSQCQGCIDQVNHMLDSLRLLGKRG